MRGIYLVGGYPDRARFLACVDAVASCGFDFIEIGLPYNDPIADGPTIAAAIHEALISGVTPGGVMEDIRTLDHLPLSRFIMTYANIIHARGFARFSDEMRGRIKGVIIPDLPNRMARFFLDQGFGIPIVPFATLETREKDAVALEDYPAPFVYFVGVRGVTGAVANLDSEEIARGIAMLRERTRKKIVIGFGIKTPRDAERALSLADGYVVGTEAVRRQKDPEDLRRYLASLAGA